MLFTSDTQSTQYAYVVVPASDLGRCQPLPLALGFSRAAEVILEQDDRQDRHRFESVLKSEAEASPDDNLLDVAFANRATLEEYARDVAVSNDLPHSHRFHVYLCQVL